MRPEFADLERFVARWALATGTARCAQRQTAAMEEIREFYEAMAARLDDMLTALSPHAPEALPEDLKPLMRLALAYCEVAPAVELFKQPAVIGGLDPTRFPPMQIPHMSPPEI